MVDSDIQDDSMYHTTGSERFNRSLYKVIELNISFQIGSHLHQRTALLTVIITALVVEIYLNELRFEISRY